MKKIILVIGLSVLIPNFVFSQDLKLSQDFELLVAKKTQFSFYDSVTKSKIFVLDTGEFLWILSDGREYTVPFPEGVHWNDSLEIVLVTNKGFCVKKRDHQKKVFYDLLLRRWRD